MVFISLPCILWFVVSEPTVQTFITRQASSILSKKLSTNVRVESVDFKLFNHFVINGVYVADQKKDTLLCINKIDVELNYFSLSKNTFHFGKIAVDQLTFKLSQDTTGALNLQFIIDAFKTKQKTSASKPILMSARELLITNLSYVMHMGKNYIYRPHGMNYHDLDVRRVHVQAYRLKFDKGMLTADVKKIALQEKCGFHLKKLSGNLKLSSKEIRLDNLFLEDDFSTIRAKYYSMKHPSFHSYKEYVNEVVMSAELDNADVDFKTIGFFSPKLKDWPLHFTHVNGIYSGPVAEMHGRNLSMNYKNNTKLNLDFSIVGLPNIEATKFNIELKELKSNKIEMEELATNFHIPTQSISPYLAHLESFVIHANFKGLFHRFKATLALNSAQIGKLNVDASYDHHRQKAIEASIQSPGIEVGKILNQSWIKRAVFRVHTQGQFESESGIALQTEINIDSVQLLTSTLLTRVYAQASLLNKELKFETTCADQNLHMSASGNLNLQESEPKGTINIQSFHCNLKDLKLRNSRDSSIVDAKATLAMNGSKLDNLNGLLNLTQFTWKEGAKQMNANNSRIKIENTEEVREIRITSPMATAEILSQKPLSQLIPSLRSMIQHYIPNLDIGVPDQFPQWAWGSKLKNADQLISLDKLQRVLNPDYSISVYCKSLKDMGSFIADNLVIADSTGGRLAWNQEEGVAMLRLLSPRIQLGSMIIEESSVNLNALRDSALCQTITNRYSVGGLMFKEVHTNHTIVQNRISSSISYQNDTDLSNSALLSFDTDILPTLLEGKQLRFGIRPSYLVINNEVWSIPLSSVYLHGKALSIDNLSVLHNDQNIIVSGSYSDSDLDTLKIQVADFNVNNFNSFTTGMQFQGKVNGYAHIMRSGKLPIFVTRMLGENIKLGDIEVGTIQLLSQWNNQTDRLDVMVDTRTNNQSEFTFYGYYSPDKNNQIHGRGVLNKTRLALITPLVKSIFSELRGTASGSFTVDGSMTKPILNGKIALDTAQLTLDFTKTTYTVSDTIRIAENDIVLHNGSLTDGMGGTATLNIVVSKIGSPEFSYHISVDPRRLAALNIKENDKRPIYGTAFASGQVIVSGNLKKTLLKIIASTDDNTTINIPLQKGGSANENSFVQFKQKEVVTTQSSSRMYDPKRKKEQKTTKDHSDFGMEMQIAATPDAAVRLVIDPQTGDAIEAIGRGNIKLELYPSREVFRIFGTYIIDRGEYTFSVQNLINKRFKIEPNSRINFNGNIFDATININTTYKLRTALGTLLGDTTERYSKKVPVDCSVSMTGKLTSPTLKFSIDAPNSDLETRGRMRSALNTEDKVVQQFIYLLVMNQFMNDQQALGVINNGNAIATAGVTVGEMLSGALSSFVANTFRNVDLNIGVNYRVNAANQTDWEVNFSTNITDRVSLSGNVDMPGGAQNRYGAANNGTVTGDVDLEVRLDHSGNVKLKAFSHSRDQFTDDLGTARHGLGIFYQKDFNTMKDLFSRTKK